MNTKKEIKTYCDGMFDLYPRYSKYLSLNNKISDYLLEIYYNKDISKNIEYKVTFDDYSSIQLASEILESISTDLRDKFIDCIRNKRIIFSDDSISATYLVEDYIMSSVKRTNTISDSINLIHEFMHHIHLEKYGNITYEEYYYFTEVLGMFGDFYSIFYIADNKKELYSDIESYLSETICSLAGCADRTLPFGVIMEIYKSKHSLSKFAFMKYIKENDISKKFMHVLEYFKDSDHYSYHEDVRYVFAFPLAYKMAKELYEKNYMIYDYKEQYEKIVSLGFEKCLHNLNLDDYFEDDNKLKELMEEILLVFQNIYSKDNTKQKKIGEV